MEKVSLETEKTNVMNAVEELKAAYQSKDISKVLACYAPGAVVLFEPGKATYEVSKLKEKFQFIFMINPEYEFTGSDVSISGDVATYLTLWKMEGKAPNGTPVVQSGLSVIVLKKQPDGKWLTVIDNPHGQLLLNQCNIPA
jgi:ketosteroid isomerase-like protein